MNDIVKESKAFGGYVVETKQEDRNGVPIGIVKGYIATWDIDRGSDRFVKGAFAESIAEHQQLKRQLRFKDQHYKTVGGWPAEFLKEDEIGLYGVAEINLVSQKGNEAYSLAKQGVLVEFSVGYSSLEDSVEDGIRVIKKAKLWEGSIVDEPMNPKAKITEVKSINQVDDVKEWSVREIETALKESGVFSNSAAKMLAGRMKPQEEEVKRSVDYKELTAILKK